MRFAGIRLVEQTEQKVRSHSSMSLRKTKTKEKQRVTNSWALLLHSSSEENPTGNFCFQSVIHSGRYSKIFKEELLNGFYLTGLLCDFFCSLRRV